jgi:hypothetical protein
MTPSQKGFVITDQASTSTNQGFIGLLNTGLEAKCAAQVDGTTHGILRFIDGTNNLRVHPSTPGALSIKTLVSAFTISLDMKGIKGTSIVIGTSDTVGSPGIEKIDTSLSSGSSFVSRLGSVHSGYVVRARQWPETIYFVTAGNDNFARIWDYTGNPMTSFNQISDQAFNWEGLDTDHYSDSFVKGSLTLGSKHAVLVKI